MLRLLLSTVALVLVVPFVIQEGYRFYVARQVCLSQWNDNKRLLENAMCSDPFVMYAHGDLQVATCERARRESLVGPTACAWRSLWEQGYGHRVVDTMTGSPWMLFGLGSVALVTLITSVVGACKTSTSMSHPTLRPPNEESMTLLLQALAQRDMRLEGGPMRSSIEAPRRKQRYIKLIDQRERVNVMY